MRLVDFEAGRHPKKPAAVSGHDVQRQTRKHRRRPQLSHRQPELQQLIGLLPQAADRRISLVPQPGARFVLSITGTGPRSLGALTVSKMLKGLAECVARAAIASQVPCRSGGSGCLANVAPA